MNRLESRIMLMLAKGDMTVKQIYEILILYKSSWDYSYITRIIRKLVRMGYVAPFNKEYKIRGKLVGITSEGMRVLSEHLKITTTTTQPLEVRDVKR